MKNKILLIYIFGSIFIVGLVVTAYGIMNNPLILPYQDWNSMPEEMRKEILQKEISMNATRNYGLAGLVISGLSLLVIFFTKSNHSENADDE